MHPSFSSHLLEISQRRLNKIIVREFCHFLFFCFMFWVNRMIFFRFMSNFSSDKCTSMKVFSIYGWVIFCTWFVEQRILQRIDIYIREYRCWKIFPELKYHLLHCKALRNQHHPSLLWENQLKYNQGNQLVQCYESRTIQLPNCICAASINKTPLLSATMIPRDKITQNGEPCTCILAERVDEVAK